MKYISYAAFAVSQQDKRSTKRKINKRLGEMQGNGWQRTFILQNLTGKCTFVTAFFYDRRIHQSTTQL